MGFTGKKALEWKIKYIEAFNAMEARLREQSAPSLPSIKRYTWKGCIVMPLTYLEQISGIFRSNLLFSLKWGKVPYEILRGADMAAFKKENGLTSSASRAALLSKDAVCAAM